jgi:hypothetical protein
MKYDVATILHERSKPVSTGCILWTGCHSEYGYGVLARNINQIQKTYRVHRLAWEVANSRPIPDGYCVCHSCDVRDCINPQHLFLGTKADNNHDRWGKNRRGKLLTGEDHQNSKITWKDVEAIRQSSDSQRVLAARHGISKTEISRIKSGRYWKASEGGK